MFEDSAAESSAPRVAPTRWVGEDLRETMDSETAQLLRACLLPVFETAQSWAELLQALHRKGYGLAFRDGRLRLTRDEDGRPLCTGGFLGVPFESLRDRLGPPHVRPLPGRPLCGQITG